MGMDPFPEPHELLAFFEAEPTLLDPSVPGYYNHQTFETQRGTDRVRCDLEPGYEEIRVRWERGGVELVSVALREVAALRVEAGSGREALVASFRAEALLPFRLQLRPTIHMFFGMAPPA
jgi:hypothetical protein